MTTNFMEHVYLDIGSNVLNGVRLIGATIRSSFLSATAYRDILSEFSDGAVDWKGKEAEHVTNLRYPFQHVAFFMGVTQANRFNVLFRKKEKTGVGMFACSGIRHGSLLSYDPTGYDVTRTPVTGGVIVEIRYRGSLVNPSPFSQSSSAPFYFTMGASDFKMLGLKEDPWVVYTTLAARGLDSRVPSPIPLYSVVEGKSVIQTEQAEACLGLHRTDQGEVQVSRASLPFVQPLQRIGYGPVTETVYSFAWFPASYLLPNIYGIISGREI